MADINDITYNAQGLVPVIIQDNQTKRILMMAWMNTESLNLTLQTGQVHFWSRSRNKLWRKGETSGNILTVSEILVDCDADTLLILANPAGPTCHTGEISCFFQSLEK